MMRLNDFRISYKLSAAFTLVALIGALLGAYAIFNMSKINEAESLLYERELLEPCRMQRTRISVSASIESP